MALALKVREGRSCGTIKLILLWKNVKLQWSVFITRWKGSMLWAVRGRKHKMQENSRPAGMSKHGFANFISWLSANAFCYCSLQARHGRLILFIDPKKHQKRVVRKKKYWKSVGFSARSCISLQRKPFLMPCVFEFQIKCQTIKTKLILVLLNPLSGAG